jgi:hypothetical protein
MQASWLVIDWRNDFTLGVMRIFWLDFWKNNGTSHQSLIATGAYMIQFKEKLVNVR